MSLSSNRLPCFPPSNYLLTRKQFTTNWVCILLNPFPLPAQPLRPPTKPFCFFSSQLSLFSLLSPQLLWQNPLSLSPIQLSKEPYFAFNRVGGEWSEIYTVFFTTNSIVNFLRNTRVRLILDGIKMDNSLNSVLSRYYKINKFLRSKFYN